MGFGRNLDIPSIIALAKQIEVDAIHPGYGFLSERAGFLDALERLQPGSHFGNDISGTFEFNFLALNGCPKRGLKPA